MERPEHVSADEAFMNSQLELVVLQLHHTEPHLIARGQMDALPAKASWMKRYPLLVWGLFLAIFLLFRWI